MNTDVVIIGTVFVDVKGFPASSFNRLGRNLGKVEFVHGGVGRNVAETLSFMGLKCKFVSTIDNSGLGKEVINRLQKNGIDTSCVKAVEKEGMGMWLAVLDDKRDLAASISQMPELKYLQKFIEKRGREIVACCRAVVLEVDLSVDIATRVTEMAKEAGRPVFGIVGNLDVVKCCPQLINVMECFICNEMEAESITGVKMNDVEDVIASARRLTQGGLKRAVITLGERGAVYYDAASEEYGHQPALPARVVDTSGAGDAFFAGTVYGLIKGRPLRDAVYMGSKVAKWTIECKQNTNENIMLYINELSASPETQIT